MKAVGMPTGVTARLGSFGYAVSDTATKPNVSTVLSSLLKLPGVSADPMTTESIREELTKWLEQAR